MRIPGNEEKRHHQELDWSSPINGFFEFREIKMRLMLRAGLNRVGYKRPSRIQETLMDVLNDNKETKIVGEFPSGAGKTTALIIAMLTKVDISKNHPHIICIAPTLESAVQIKKTLESIGKLFHGLKVKLGIKGEKGGRLDSQIIVGTVGKVFQWFNDGTTIDRKKLTLFVVDDLQWIMQHSSTNHQLTNMIRCLGSSVMNIFLSTVMSANTIKSAKRALGCDVCTIVYRREEENKKHDFVQTSSINGGGNLSEKFDKLCEFIQDQKSKTVIFLNTKQRAGWIVAKLLNEGIPATLSTGDMAKEDRLDTLKSLSEERETILVTTDMMARGVELYGLRMVINFDKPRNEEVSESRAGRVKRFGRHGRVINFLD